MENYTGALLDRVVSGDIDSLTPSELAAVHVALERRLGENRALGVSTVPEAITSEVRGLGFGDGTTLILILLSLGPLTGVWVLPRRWTFLVLFAAGVGVLRCVFRLLDSRMYGNAYEQAYKRVNLRMAELVEARRRAADVTR